VTEGLETVGLPKRCSSPKRTSARYDVRHRVHASHFCLQDAHSLPPVLQVGEGPVGKGVDCTCDFHHA
jgi:hypothetical protein